MGRAEIPPQEVSSGHGMIQPKSGQGLFVTHPRDEDFHELAHYVAAASPAALHPALWPQRDQVAQRLRQMAEEPHREEHQAAYHALRLLAW